MTVGRSKKLRGYNSIIPLSSGNSDVSVRGHLTDSRWGEESAQACAMPGLANHHANCSLDGQSMATTLNARFDGQSISQMDQHSGQCTPKGISLTVSFSEPSTLSKTTNECPLLHMKDRSIAVSRNPRGHHLAHKEWRPFKIWSVFSPLC